MGGRVVHPREREGVAKEVTPEAAGLITPFVLPFTSHLKGRGLRLYPHPPPTTTARIDTTSGTIHLRISPHLAIFSY